MPEFANEWLSLVPSPLRPRDGQHRYRLAQVTAGKGVGQASEPTQPSSRGRECGRGMNTGPPVTGGEEAVPASPCRASTNAGLDPRVATHLTVAKSTPRQRSSRAFAQGSSCGRSLSRSSASVVTPRSRSSGSTAKSGCSASAPRYRLRTLEHRLRTPARAGIRGALGGPVSARNAGPVRVQAGPGRD